jgi:hypothetical protein
VFAYRDKEVVGVFVRFRAPLHRRRQLISGDQLSYVTQRKLLSRIKVRPQQSIQLFCL